MADDTITWGWGYTHNAKTKPFKLVLHSFVDTISKNGVVLLNMAPRADGSIPDDQRLLLTKLGKWLGTYGEAVYSTRPWLVYGTGPGDKGLKENIHGGVKGANFDWKDLRFTQNGNAVYIHQMGKAPAGKKHMIKIFQKDPRTVDSVTLLSSEEEITWAQSDQGLEVTIPADQPDDLVNVYKVVLKP